VLSGPSKAVSIAEILREVSLARAERQLFIRPRPASALKFHEHLARTPAEDVVAFSTVLRQQNREDRAAAKRVDWCPPSTIGSRLDVWG
jgi:hypothetical protein